VTIHDLPALDAILNGTAAVLLVIAYVLIRRGKRDAHKKVMLAAFTVSILFLISYLIYHSQVGVFHYAHTGPIRKVYFTILFTHTVLAALVPFLAVITLRRGLKGVFVKHKKLARWTFPIWLYVSVTGVVVYLMLYQF
jgi:protein SCO1/2/putative membrane protein